MGNDVFRDMVASYYGSQEAGDFILRTWMSTPWMVEARTGSSEDPRHVAAVGWCRETFGPEDDPFRGRAGLWKASKSIYGWTYFGFATEEALQRFMARPPLRPRPGVGVAQAVAAAPHRNQ